MAAAPLVTKNDFRKKVWDHLEKNDLAEFPRPVHNRIPNFKGAAAAAHSLAALDEFRQAKVVKVNPDKPQETVRFLALEVEKTVLVPTPRLRHGLFNRLIPPSLAKEELRRVARAEGVSKFSTPVGLENIIPVDLIVVGSVAVSKDGYRIGKGEGYADLEYAMARGAGAVSEDTMVVTTVHDDQVFDYLPPELFGSHDLTVDVIVTPTQVIRVSKRHPKPTGIIWKLVTPRKLKAIPVLKALREVEATAGKDVTLGEPSEADLAESSARKSRRLRADGEPARQDGYRGPRRRRELGAGDAEPAYSDADDEGADKRRRRRPAAPRRRRRAASETAANDAQEEPEHESRGPQRRRRRPPPPPPEPPRHEQEPRRPRARRDRPPIDHADGLTVIVRRIPSDARPRDLREAIVAADSPATILSWKGRQGVALLRLRSADAVLHLLDAGDSFMLVNELVLLERYDSRRAAPPADRPARNEKPERPKRPERPEKAEATERRDRKERGERRKREEREERSPNGVRRRPGPRAVSHEEAEVTVFIGRLPSTTRVRELRAALLAAGAQEPNIAWKGRRGMAFVRLKSPEAAEELVAAADQLKVISDELVVERYKGRERHASENGGEEMETAAAGVRNGEVDRVPPAGGKEGGVKPTAEVGMRMDAAADMSSGKVKPAADPVKRVDTSASDVPEAADSTAKSSSEAKVTDTKALKPTPAETEPVPSKLEPTPAKAETAPTKAEPNPAKNVSVKAELSPAKAVPTPAGAELAPASAEPAAAKAEAAAAKAEPATAKSEPAAAKAEPAAAKAEPATAKAESATAKTEPATAEAESPAAKSEPAAAKAEPAAAKAEPATAKAEPTAAKSEPAAAKAEPAPAKAEPVTAKAEPAAAKAEPATVNTEPAAAEAEPVAAEAEAAPAKVEPAHAKADPVPSKADTAPANAEPARADTNADGLDSKTPPDSTEPAAAKTGSAAEDGKRDGAVAEKAAAASGKTDAAAGDANSEAA